MTTLEETVELAWAAGFFDGEGCVFLRNTQRHKGGTTGKMYPLVTVELTIAQVRPEPLERFHKIIGIGGFRGPYKQRKENHSSYYKWVAAGRPSALIVAQKLWPFLSSPKKEQFQDVWRNLEILKTKKSPKLYPLPN